MENGEVVLEVGREELTLDRPPTSIATSSSPKSLRSQRKSTDESNELVDNEALSECQRKEFETNETKKIEKPKKDNKEEEEDGNLESNIYEEGSDLNIESNINAAQLSKKFSHDEESKIAKSYKKQTKYFQGKQLISCLKKVNKNDVNHDNGKEKKSVHYFKEQDSCVREYIEPVDPWRNVRTPSTIEVISFYRNSCQKLRCKPIDKIIKQIQETIDLSTRAGTLVLRGSRLDSRSCEALESIFRRVQFENLDLENCSLEEDGATAILEMIEFYHSTCKLNIACNPKIGMRGWQALCRMLRKTPCLTYLDARRTLLTDMTMPTFGRCLKADPPLKILHLEGVFLSGRPMLILTTAMKYNKVLEELYLGDNDLSSSDGPPIGAMLTYNTTLQLLDLRNNQIKDIGIAHIGNGISDQAEQCQGGLCSLILWNNGLTHEGMTYLSDGLVQTNSLKALNLGQNRIGDLGIQKLKIGLIKNKSLHKLGFLNTKLGSEGAVALAEVLADSLSITRIDIRENNIQTAGLMAFSMALKVNQSLLRLDLDKDIRKEPGMEQVMQTVLVDIYNYCHRNKQIARQTLASTSSMSPVLPRVSRQSSTSSEHCEHINTDDIFHPETERQDVTPFSPVFSDPNRLPNFAEVIKNKSDEQTSDISNKPQSLSCQQQPQTAKEDSQHKQKQLPLDVSKSTQKEILNAILSEAHELPKDQQPVHILNKPTPDSSDRRSSRFSVTKILDSLGTHAAGVANKFVSATTKQHLSPLPKAKELEDIQHVPLQVDQASPVEEITSEEIMQTDKLETNSVENDTQIIEQETDGNEKEIVAESINGEKAQGEYKETISILRLASQRVPNVEDSTGDNETENISPCEHITESVFEARNLVPKSVEDHDDMNFQQPNGDILGGVDANEGEYRNSHMGNIPITVDQPS